MGTTKTLVIVAVILVAAFAGIWIMKAAFLPAKTVITQIDSAGNIIDDVYNPTSAVYNYEWFKQRFEDIHATEIQITNTKENMKQYRLLYGENASEWGWQTRQDYNSLNKIYLGQQNYYESIVAEYNARSKMANREIFKDKLPLHVDKMLW